MLILEWKTNANIHRGYKECIDCRKYISPDDWGPYEGELRYPTQHKEVCKDCIAVSIYRNSEAFRSSPEFIAEREAWRNAFLTGLPGPKRVIYHGFFRESEEEEDEDEFNEVCNPDEESEEEEDEDEFNEVCQECGVKMSEKKLSEEEYDEYPGRDEGYCPDTGFWFCSERCRQSCGSRRRNYQAFKHQTDNYGEGRRYPKLI